MLYFNMLAVVALYIVYAIVPVFALRKYTRRLARSQQSARTRMLDSLGIGLEDLSRKRIVGFFHPYCNAGGGGERVLWAAIALIQREHSEIINVVYSGDTDASKTDIVAKVKARFDINIAPETLYIVHLYKRRWVEDSSWPRFTLLGQSLGSMLLAHEAMQSIMPDLFIDTMGYAFTFPVVALLASLGRKSVPIGAYVHYPTISTTMVSRVSRRTEGHSNSAAVSSSAVISAGKLLYYRLFMQLYASCLKRASFLMVNSSWTKDHVDRVLNHSDALALSSLPSAPSLRSTQIVYPSCNTRDMAALPLGNRVPIVLSIAQFRPEKEHSKQLHAFAELLSAYSELGTMVPSVKLVLVGGARNEADIARVEALRQLARQLNIAGRVEFRVNAPYKEMLELLGKASVGLSTMVDEHFGINIVEFLAAGVIPVTHASGGPKHDIVVPVQGKPTGFHAHHIEDFAQAMYETLVMPHDEAMAMRARGRAWSLKVFSTEEFEKGWNASGWFEMLTQH